MNIIDRISVSFSKELPFVAYRKPNLNSVSGFFQYSDKLYISTSFSEEGFVFAPFDNGDKAILFPKSTSEVISEAWKWVDEPENNTGYSILHNAKEAHIQLVDKAVQNIKTSDLQKVVISRNEQLQVNHIDIADVFQKLLHTYAKAMVYVWYHPKIGLWMGATPETLLKANGSCFSTMSLASTQPFKGHLDVVWNEKEIEEQSLVTEFITSQLQSMCSSLTVKEREAVQAGNLIHLKTVVKGELKKHEGLNSLIETLHPTPAVCGFPRQLAKSFILDEEGYNRKFYTGFLGEINMGDCSELYVNLRCMEIEKNTVNLYVGGGITKDSSPEKEWEETVLKTNTLKRVL